MLGLSHYASSDEEEEDQKSTREPQAVTALAVGPDTTTAKDGKDLLKAVSPSQQPQQWQQPRLLDSLPALRTYPAARLDAKCLTALQQPAVDALKADLWTPQTSQQYNVSSSMHRNGAAERSA